MAGVTAWLAGRYRLHLNKLRPKHHAYGSYHRCVVIRANKKHPRRGVARLSWKGGKGHTGSNQQNSCIEFQHRHRCLSSPGAL
jgi:hypothetical protein